MIGNRKVLLFAAALSLAGAYGAAAYLRESGMIVERATLKTRAPTPPAPAPAPEPVAMLEPLPEPAATPLVAQDPAPAATPELPAIPAPAVVDCAAGARAIGDCHCLAEGKSELDLRLHPSQACIVEENKHRKQPVLTTGADGKVESMQRSLLATGESAEKKALVVFVPDKSIPVGAPPEVLASLKKQDVLHQTLADFIAGLTFPPQTEEWCRDEQAQLQNGLDRKRLHDLRKDIDDERNHLVSITGKSRVELTKLGYMRSYPQRWDCPPGMKPAQNRCMSVMGEAHGRDIRAKLDASLARLKERNSRLRRTPSLYDPKKNTN